MSIENGTHNLHVSKVVCGPGHGISIGSLGDDNSRAEVSGITIDSVQLYGTTNGACIKTYQGGSGIRQGHHIPKHDHVQCQEPDNHRPELLRQG